MKCDLFFFFYKLSHFNVGVYSHIYFIYLFLIAKTRLVHLHIIQRSVMNRSLNIQQNKNTMN